MKEEKKSDECDKCYGYNYELLGCCSGHECGCMGQPVDAKPCPKCNADGEKKPSLEAQKAWTWFFLTKEEWNKYLAEKEWHNIYKATMKEGLGCEDGFAEDLLQSGMDDFDYEEDPKESAYEALSCWRA